MSTEKGNLTINSENIFPIIKKWLYSDHDIFIREQGEKFSVKVMSSPLDKTITFIDNGIGMTRDEVDKYINQIAFSGAQDFLEKYKDKDANDQIIGHFGLGFYSAFMVADKVTIETCSYQEGAQPVYWESDGGTTYEMGEGNYTERGTRITLYLSDDSLEFSNEFRVKEIIGKYCSFMPVEIYYINEDEAKKQDKEATVDAKAKVRKAEEDDFIGGSDETAKTEEVEAEAADTKEEDNSPKPLNDINPLWMRTPGDCTDEDYKDFYQRVFYDFKEPMFWIHLNMDYPFNLKGILYFPRLNPTMDQLDGKVKLYNNQVFVADNIKEVIPEFLLVLKGIIDCPDLPLNVSRSALQNDGFVKKISDYITKKVADKLTGMFKTDRERYESLWEDLSPFIKFGCLKDDKFNEKMEKTMIFRNLEGKYISLEDYLEAAKDKHENKVFYVSDEQTQAQYIEMFKKEGMDAIFLTHNIDSPYITSMEAKNDKVKFLRIDSDISENLKGEDLAEDTAKEYNDKLTEVFKKALGKEKLKLEARSLKDETVSSMLIQSEQERRMADMMKLYSFGGMSPMDFGAEAETLILNVNNKLVKYILDNPEAENTNTICAQLYDLAVLANRPLTAEELTGFVKRSNEILNMMI